MKISETLQNEIVVLRAQRDQVSAQILRGEAMLAGAQLAENAANQQTATPPPGQQEGPQP
jgi:hypothetical protein